MKPIVISIILLLHCMASKTGREFQTEVSDDTITTRDTIVVIDDKVIKALEYRYNDDCLGYEFHTALFSKYERDSFIETLCHAFPNEIGSGTILSDTLVVDDTMMRLCIRGHQGKETYVMKTYSYEEGFYDLTFLKLRDDLYDYDIPSSELLIETVPFQIVDVRPKFSIGGYSSFEDWIIERYDEQNLPQINKRVVITFTVDSDGTVSRVRLYSKDISVKTSLDLESILLSSPKWIPGKDNGRKVKVSYSMSITI